MTKPVLILKNGRSDIGSIAVKSHTSSIAGRDQIYDAVFKQHHGIFRVNNFYEMLNIAQIFSMQPLPKGKNIAIITGSGSLGILACDELKNQGLSLAKLDKETINEIKNIIPNWVSIGGTIDLGPSQMYTLVPSLKTIFKDINVDSILFIFTVPKGPLQEFEGLSSGIKTSFRLIGNLTRSLNKPLIIVAFGSRWVFEFIIDIAIKFNIPVIEHLEHALKALKLMYEYNISMKNKMQKEL